MTPNEQAILHSLIDGHHAAMRYQVDHPDARLEYLNHHTETWRPSESILLQDKGTNSVAWHRLAPAPRLVDLDQSDFLGDGRVTHLRPICRPDLIYSVGWIGPTQVHIPTVGEIGYERLHSHWQCSRDNGATFGPCSKESKA